jgi:hypothetical protein
MYPEALNCFEKLIQLEPNNSEAYCHKGIIYNLQNVNLSFTSIPYFNLEEYSNVMEYENIEVWKETFIKSLYKFPNLLLNTPKDLENCFENVLDKYYLKNAVSKHLAKKNEEEKFELILKFF